MYVRTYVWMYVCMYEFPDDHKQEILEPRLFNMFRYCTFKLIIFVAVLQSMTKIFQEHFLDNPFFRLVAILKSITKFSKNNFNEINY